MNTPILFVTAVSAEQEAVLRGLGTSVKHADVIVGGVGPFVPAVRTAQALMKQRYRLVVSAGIAGGFAHQTSLGDVVIADQIIAAELGAETAAGFVPVEQLGFGHSRIQPMVPLVQQLATALHKSAITPVVGPILTVSTATGTQDTADQLLALFPEAVAEAMEGFGVATAAQEHHVPIVELRAISNHIGPRDRDCWQINRALESLSTATSIFSEVFK